MDASVSSAVSASLSMNQAQTQQEAQNTMLKGALDNQKAQAAQLMESVSPEQSLATEGSVGTQINTQA